MAPWYALLSPDLSSGFAAFSLSQVLFRAHCLRFFGNATAEVKGLGLLLLRCNRARLLRPPQGLCSAPMVGEDQAGARTGGASCVAADGRGPILWLDSRAAPREPQGNGRVIESRVSKQVSPVVCGGGASGVPGTEGSVVLPGREKGSRRAICWLLATRGRWSHSLMLGPLGTSPATVLPFTRSENGPRALPVCPSTGAARSAGFLSRALKAGQ